MSDEPLRPRCPIDGDAAAVSLRYSKNGYSIFESRPSGLLFVHPVPTAEELLEIYGADYFKRGNKYAQAAGARGADPQRDNDERKLGRLREFVGSGRLLDIGSAMGGFVELAKSSGFEVEGVELSEYAARETVRRIGVVVHNSSLEDARIPAESFDCVTMWDVIEHLADPTPTLRAAHRVLRPGGRLFLATGDAGSPYARLMGKRWHLLTPPQHLYFYTRASLKTVLSQNGFSTSRISYPGKHASLDFILFKAEESVGGVARALRSLVRRLRLENVRLYVNVRDIMECVAVKIDG